jgi:hypothetical protein
MAPEVKGLGNAERANLLVPPDVDAICADPMPERVRTLLANYALLQAWVRELLDDLDRRDGR